MSQEAFSYLLGVATFTPDGAVRAIEEVDLTGDLSSIEYKINIPVNSF